MKIGVPEPYFGEFLRIKWFTRSSPRVSKRNLTVKQNVHHHHQHQQQHQWDNMKRSVEPTSCSGCWSFLSPFVVLTFFPLPTLLLTASVEATGKQITVKILPCVHKKFTGNETCTCLPPTPTKMKMLALLVLRHFFLSKTLSDFVGVPLNSFYQILQYKSWIDV